MIRPARSDLALLLIAGAVVVLVALSTLIEPPASAAERAGGLAAELRCPTCAGLSIGDSPAPMAAQMRAVVAERIAAGASDDDVRQFFVARYGRWILLDPPIAGVDLALWIAPGLVITAGAGLLTWRTRRPAQSAARPSSGPDRPTGRLAGGLAVAFMLAAVTVPLVMAVGPRLAGAEITGRPAGGGVADIGALEERAAARPTDPVALVDLGDALLDADRDPEAADRYRAALELDPGNARALLGVGVILLEADRPDAAADAFDRVLALAPDQPDALLMRAIARLRLDGVISERVRIDLERFLAAAPGDARRAMAESLLAGTASEPAPSVGP